MHEELREQLLVQAMGALRMNVAYFGVSTGLFDRLDGAMSADALAEAAGRDPSYVRRWADAAFALGLLDRNAGGFILTDAGRLFRRDTPGTLFPLAVQVVLGAHMTERAAGLSATGERPGEKVLMERETIAPLFGPMLEHAFGPLFDQHIVGSVPVFSKVDEEGGLVVDLGCGNGWYLRRLAQRCVHVRGIGLDTFEENIRQATAAAELEGVADRVSFRAGDLHQFTVDEPVSLIAMNRALHHVWNDEADVFTIVRDHLAPGGAAVIWEPVWPAEPSELRSHPRFAGIAFQNLAEHVQGNHFLQPKEIAAAFERVGMTPRVHLFMGGTEAVVVGVKPS